MIKFSTIARRSCSILGKYRAPGRCTSAPTAAAPARAVTTSTPDGKSSGGQKLNQRSFHHDDLKIQLTTKKAEKPSADNIGFGKYYTDHMLEVNWSQQSGWEPPQILPFHDFVMHPASKVFHYSQELFEGMKAYADPKGEIRLFRPELNMQRFVSSAARIGLPLFEPSELQKCIMSLVDIDRDWVPTKPSTALYIRPTFIGTEPALGVIEANQALLYVITSPVGLYYSKEEKPVKLLADPQYVRAWPGGTGDKKLGCNYGPTLPVQADALSLGLDQVLWLFGPDQQITEVGSMNVFILLKSKDGQPELVTPKLSGLILPGITRRSVLELAADWNDVKVSERDITIHELREAVEQGRAMEMFGTGTAAVVTPVAGIVHRVKGKTKELVIPTTTSEMKLYDRIRKELADIQYGIKEHPWSVVVERTKKG